MDMIYANGLTIKIHIRKMFLILKFWRQKN